MPMRKNEEIQTVKAGLDALIDKLNEAKSIIQEMDEKFGITMGFSAYSPYGNRHHIPVSRGIDELAEAAEREAKYEDCITRSKRMIYRKAEFYQFMDTKTGVFVKAGAEKPKVEIAEE